MVKYIDIANDIRAKIVDETYTYGQKLPYEYVLCVSYHCNKETMKKALDILVKEGLIVRRRGAGTFVKDYDPGKQSDRVMNRNAKGLTAKFEGIKTVTSKVIAFEVIPCDDFIASKLQIEEGSFVYHVIRLRLVDDKPLVIEIIYLPISVITNLRLEHVQSSMYRFVEEDLHYRIQSSHKTITAHLSSPLEQEYLNLKDYEPYIQEEKTSYLSTGTIFEYSINRFHYNDFEMQDVVVRV